MYLPVVLAALGPVFADNDNYYYGGGCGCCSIFIIWFFFWAIGKFTGEFEKGRKTGMSDAEVLDELPQKRQVMFKGEKIPQWKIAGRSKATKAILKFLSYTDNWFDRKYVGDVADEAVRLVKEAIEARSVRGIERRVTPDLLEEIRAGIKKHRQDETRQVYDRVEVTDVNVVHVEAAAGKANHTFTALISVKSKDYVEDDESGEVLKGDRKTYAYQEFWTFRRSEKRWLVELIRPSTDVDQVMESKNVMAAVELEEFSKDANPEHLSEVVGR
jgi:predicted lipid-binding transport protein (Tim44 family)